MGAAAALSLAGGSPASPAPKPKVKLGVTLYSYNGDLQVGTMTMEDCLVDLADMGAEGVEFLPDALVPNYPDPPDRWVQQWFAWLEKYHLKPSAMDGGADTKLFMTRALSAQEIADQIVRDLRLANRLGFKVYRGLGSSWPSALGPKGSVWASGVTHLQVYDRVLPYAEKYDVRIAEELHIPFLFKSEWMDQTMNYLHKTGTKHLGFNPDMSIFVRRPIPSLRPEDLVGRGTSKALVDFVYKAREDGVPEESAREQARKIDPGSGEMLAAMVYHLTYRSTEQNDPQTLAALMPYIFHIHAKFYLVEEDLRDEHSIPYSEIIPVLAHGGYSNYLSSEYEGDRSPFAASHQIRRQHLMIRRMWDAA
jgi:sugar phosphate isomerase/epimerase